MPASRPAAQPNDPATDPVSRTPPVRPAIPKARLWCYRLSGVFLGPLVILGALELGLRLLGYGYPTSFFLRSSIQGQDFYIPNEHFSARFFPPRMSRSVLPFRVPVVKPAHSYRIMLFGESAANGDPEPSYGVGRYLEALLRERFPGADFQVVCVAITAIDSHVVLPIARECAGCQGDLWLIYMGNNEMVGPFGAQTVFGARAPHRTLVRAVLALESTRVGQLLASLVGGLHSPSGLARSWGGMQMFAESRLRHDAPARLRAYANFNGNLEDILSIGERAGVPIVLSTVAVNLKDCAPFASEHGPGLTDAQQAAWNQAYEAGVKLEGAGDCGAALPFYQQAARIDSQYAELQFRMGRCDLALTNYAQAQAEFALARDYDALAFRADTIINQAIRTAAGRHAISGVHLVDAAQALAAHAPGGIPGAELFYEHVHLNFEGNYLLALSFAEQVKGLLPPALAAHDHGGWASQESCERRLAVTVWDRQRVWQPIFNRISFPPFTGQLDHEAFFQLCEAKLSAAKARMEAQSPEQAREIYQHALALAPQDALLHANFEQFLEAGGRAEEALAECERLCELAPFLPMPFYTKGLGLVRQGKSGEAQQCFEQALALKSDFAQARIELGLLLAGQGQTAQARSCFRRALRADPNSAEACLNLGFLEQCQGDLAGALPDYEEAARLQPRGPADAFHQAVGLAAAQRSMEAIACFRTLVQQVPTFWQARYLLGMELAATGNTAEAQAQFAEVLRWRPDYAPLLARTLPLAAPQTNGTKP